MPKLNPHTNTHTLFHSLSQIAAISAKLKTFRFLYFFHQIKNLNTNDNNNNDRNNNNNNDNMNTNDNTGRTFPFQIPNLGKQFFVKVLHFLWV